MRIYLDQFSTLISNKIYPLYLLSGEDETLLNLCQEQLYAYLSQSDFQGPVYQSDATQLFSSQLSLFSQKEIIVHKLAKSSAEFTRDLTHYAEKLSKQPNHSYEKIYVLLTGKLDKSQAKSKWVQCIEANGAVLTIWPPEGYKLKKWLSDTAEYFKLALTESQKNCILDNLPNNLSDIYQLLKQLNFCFNNQVITDELIHQLLCHQPQYSAQQLIEAILNCNTSQTIEISRFLHQQDKTILTIWWLSQLFDWWEPAADNKNSQNTYFSVSPLKNRAQNLPLVAQQKIQRQISDWKNQLFQLDIYAKSSKSQSLEAEHQLNQLLLSVVKTISAKQL